MMTHQNTQWCTIWMRNVHFGEELAPRMRHLGRKWSSWGGLSQWKSLFGGDLALRAGLECRREQKVEWQAHYETLQTTLWHYVLKSELHNNTNPAKCAHKWPFALWPGWVGAFLWTFLWGIGSRDDHLVKLPWGQTMQPKAASKAKCQLGGTVGEANGGPRTDWRECLTIYILVWMTN